MNLPKYFIFKVRGTLMGRRRVYGVSKFLANSFYVPRNGQCPKTILRVTNLCTLSPSSTNSSVSHKRWFLSSNRDILFSGRLQNEYDLTHFSIFPEDVKTNWLTWKNSGREAEVPKRERCGKADQPRGILP
ncbi:hypothetical protein E2C01_089287 [Portunus trituberculatus]|uniref:Uncharacterized protein n=1 Tax=Portunus trituberculatus TaxID=210409 RepID=A0A5B7JHS3_PORTR|nr:hypothetical protein [Portunus trituberculatus]